MRAAGLFLLSAGALVAGGGSEPVLGWSKMVWSEMTVAGHTVPHSALMIDANVEGMPAPALMQLDTGAINCLYLKNGGRNGATVEGTAAGRRFYGEWFQFRDRSSYTVDGKSVIATIGAPFFERRILILDFVSSRVAILDTAQDLPTEVERRATFTPLEYRDGKMFVTFRINDNPEREMFFDSGSSAFAMTTSRRRWLELTGRQPDDSRNEKWNVNSWGNVARMIGAPMKGEMCFARACLPSPLVFFESSGLKNLDFDQYRSKASGLFGNAPFDGRVTVIVDIPHARFGVIAGSLANLIPR